MENPVIQYSLESVDEFFKKEKEEIHKHLAEQVKKGIYSKEFARKKYDMYLSVLIYINVLKNIKRDSEEAEDSLFELYQNRIKQEINNLGTSVIKNVIDKWS